MCTTKAQRSIALGFLFTYAALLSFESDFTIAKERGLLPSDLDIPQWTKWQNFVEETITSSIYKDTHQRFHYGELRLGRLNAIYLFTRFGYYMNQWPNYSSFLRDQLGWLATTTIFIALVLTAMQVGLATNQLKTNAPYMTAAYGFSVCNFGAVEFWRCYTHSIGDPGCYQLEIPKKKISRAFRVHQRF